MNRRNASLSSRSATIACAIRWSRRRSTSERRVDGGGIRAAASAPIRRIRSASSLFFVWILVRKSFICALDRCDRKYLIPSPRLGAPRTCGVDGEWAELFGGWTSVPIGGNLSSRSNTRPSNQPASVVLCIFDLNSLTRGETNARSLSSNHDRCR